MRGETHASPGSTRRFRSLRATSPGIESHPSSVMLRMLPSPSRGEGRRPGRFIPHFSAPMPCRTTSPQKLSSVSATASGTGLSFPCPVVGEGALGRRPCGRRGFWSGKLCPDGVPAVAHGCGKHGTETPPLVASSDRSPTTSSRGGKTGSSGILDRSGIFAAGEDPPVMGLGGKALNIAT